MSEHTRQPPHDLDLEKSILGSIMLDEDAVHIAAEHITSEMFYYPAHQNIYTAIQTNFENNIPNDPVTVKNEMQKQDLLKASGGDQYLLEVSAFTASSANLEYHCGIVKDKYFSRKLISSCADIITKSYEETGDIETLLDSAEATIFDISSGKIKQDFVKVADELNPIISKLENADSTAHEGVLSGFAALDDLTSGFHGGELIIVAARPGMGKTAFALCLSARSAIRYETKVAFFSLEMSCDSLIERLLQSESKVSMRKLKAGKIPKKEIQKVVQAAGPLFSADIFIDDSASINVMEIRAKCRKLKSKGLLDLIVIDYLQLISPGSKKNLQSRENEVSYISRSLKMLAKDLHVPVICLSQLSRKSEGRTDPRPQLSDLRESGAIEQDADTVLFVFREDYGPHTEDVEEGKSQIIIGKQRSGPIGEADLTFIADCTCFEDYTPMYDSQDTGEWDL